MDTRQLEFEKAYEEGFITRWDLDFYRNIWGKSKLTEKQLINKYRINELIQNMVNHSIFPSFNQ